MEIENKLPKGSFAVAHIQSSGYSLIAGTFHYSHYFIVQVTKASRDGKVKEYAKYSDTGSSEKVDRKTTIFALPGQFADTGAAMFAAQKFGDFIGYHDKAELKAAFEAVVPA